MPIYEYACTKCDERFARHESIGDHGRRRPECPKCGSRAVEPVFKPFFAKDVDAALSRLFKLSYLRWS